MKKYFIILFLFVLANSARSQLVSYIMHGDTVFYYNPSTRDSMAVNKPTLKTVNNTSIWGQGNIALGSVNYAVDAQSSDSYVITLSPAPASYTDGMMIVFKAKTQNTTGCSINVNGLGAKTIVKRVNTTPATGDILAGMLCWIVYDGTNFVLLNPIVN